MKSILRAVLLMLVVCAQAQATRVEVFEKGQQFWDVKAGDSLSLICQQIKPGTKGSRLSCQREILKKNPAAFIDNNPSRLKAGQRLWLPGSYRPHSQLDDQNYDTKHFNWGSIKTPK